MKNGRSVSVIIPTFNERDNIAPLVEQVHRAAAGYDYRILFVDDNSRDGTAEVARSLSRQYPVDVMVRVGKKGLASAIVDGLAEARGDTVVVMDADLQHPPEVISQLLDAIDGGADVAIASRYTRGGSCEGWGLTRRVISKVASALAHIAIHSARHVKDPMSGFFAFRREVVEGVQLQPTGYKILLELLALGRFETAVEVPFRFQTRNRGESKLNARQQVHYLKHLFSILRRTGEFMRFLKFVLVGLSGVGVNIGFQWLFTRIAGLADYSALALSIELSIISNFILNDNFTFRDRRVRTARATLWREAKYNMVALPGAAINWGVALALIRFVGMPDLAANLIGIVLATLWNYILSTLWAWGAPAKRTRTGTAH